MEDVNEKLGTIRMDVSPEVMTCVVVWFYMDLNVKYIEHNRLIQSLCALYWKVASRISFHLILPAARCCEPLHTYTRLNPHNAVPNENGYNQGAASFHAQSNAHLRGIQVSL
jgi:hypothetical protein